MVRLSKQTKRRKLSPRRPKGARIKPPKAQPKHKIAFKEHENALEGDLARVKFIPKIK